MFACKSCFKSYFGLFSYFVAHKFRASGMCAILPRMEEDWIEQVKVRGMSGAFNTALDALEPLGPLAAQMLYVMQPALGVFGFRTAISELAAALDEPGGIEQLRQRLNRTDDET